MGELLLHELNPSQNFYMFIILVEYHTIYLDPAEPDYTR